MSTTAIVIIVAAFLLVDGFIMFKVLSRARANRSGLERTDGGSSSGGGVGSTSESTSSVVVGGATVAAGGDYLAQQYADGAPSSSAGDDPTRWGDSTGFESSSSSE